MDCLGIFELPVLTLSLELEKKEVGIEGNK